MTEHARVHAHVGNDILFSDGSCVAQKLSGGLKKEASPQRSWCKKGT